MSMSMNTRNFDQLPETMREHILSCAKYGMYGTGTTSPGNPITVDQMYSFAFHQYQLSGFPPPTQMERDAMKEQIILLALEFRTKDIADWIFTLN